MAKVRKCNHKDCDKPRLKSPGNNTFYFKYCVDHQIEVTLTKQRAEKANDKIGLEKARSESNYINKSSKKTDRQRAMDRADSWFSRYIRFNYSFDMNGSLHCECYTCRKQYLMKSMDNGHWQKRENKTTRYHENNARPQCTECNDHKKGEYAKFELRLIEEIGTVEVDNIKRLARSSGEDSEIFYREQSDKYRILCNKLFSKRKVRNPWAK